MQFKTIKAEVNELVKRANFSLRKDVQKRLVKSLDSENRKLAKKTLGWILENSYIAKQKRIALCQDTGFPLVFIEAGKDVRVSAQLVQTIQQTVQESYKKNYLRASLIDPLNRSRPGYKGVLAQVEFNPRAKGLKITLFIKGFGSENKTQLKMFNPTVAGVEVEDFVVDVVRQAGAQACPPFVVGVGLGGCSDSVLLLAKKALIKDINKPNRDKGLLLLEKNILKKINALGIGPMGLGGKYTALGVNIEKASTHIAGFPVGVNVSCWALRSASVKLKKEHIN
jgi:fumarate hydratase subunit alpha